MREAGVKFYDGQGIEGDLLEILKNHGVNTIRLRLWVDPETKHSGFIEVKAFSEELHQKGFKTWLTLHYSDWWADPGSQETPVRWKDLSLEVLRDSLESYTERVVQAMSPDYVQIGNEINNGMLHPVGEIHEDEAGFLSLLDAGVKGARKGSDNVQIMLHHAGYEGAQWFYDRVSQIDYDLIGISYYPHWHGKSIIELRHAIQLLTKYDKGIVMAETSYPFTLDWDDFTTNIIGLEDQLILPQYPATPEGQKSFVEEMRAIMQEAYLGTGLCYWGGEWVAWKGDQAIDGSPWENQAVFDFNNKALPVLRVFETR